MQNVEVGERIRSNRVCFFVFRYFCFLVRCWRRISWWWCCSLSVICLDVICLIYKNLYMFLRDQKDAGAEASRSAIELLVFMVAIKEKRLDFDESEKLFLGFSIPFLSPFLPLLY